MDKYVKRIKRKEDGGHGSIDTDVEKFYVPGNGLWMAADTSAACEPALKIRQPAAPQKTEQPVPPSSPILDESTDLMDSSIKMGRMKRSYVSRRLLFDEEEKTSVNKFMDQKLIINSQSTAILEEKMATEENRYQIITECLSARGFDVKNHISCENVGLFSGQYGHCLSTIEFKSAFGRELLSPVGSQFKCLSVFEGIVYSVRVAAAGPTGDKLVETAKVLAAIGPHPHIVSYYCHWTDAFNHFVQMEHCPVSLSSLHMDNITECRTVLEHISCALHYLHSGKMYAHNCINRWNIYLVVDGDCVAYKLGGFDGATKLPVDLDTGSAATVADVQSLCSTVSGLIEDINCKGNLYADEDLRLYLMSLAGKVNSATANSLSVWKWCCSSRQTLRQTSVSSMMFRQIGTGSVNRRAVTQTMTASFKNMGMGMLPKSP